MMYDLPTSLEVNGTSYEIRSDYRCVLDICAALSDPELDGWDKTIATLVILYPGIDDMPVADYREAVRRCFWFISCGDENQNRKAPKLMDWDQDFKYVVAPINRVCGKEIRSVEYMHWWTFVSSYYEIGGDCLFAQIVRIRDKKAKGKPLDKSEQKWYRDNRNLVDFKTPYTDQEKEVFSAWGIK